MGDAVVRALDAVDLDIDPGEFVAITGASGSGKSTLMHLLGCLDRPTAGRYVLDGQDVSALTDRQLADVRSRMSVDRPLPDMACKGAERPTTTQGDVRDGRRLPIVTLRQVWAPRIAELRATRR